MVWDEEKQHGEPEELITPRRDSRPQRPLTTDEKLAATTFNVDSRGTSVERDSNSTPLPPQETGILAKLRNFEAFMDRKLGVESEAIDRKLPEDRKHVPWHSQLNMALLWASGTMNVSCFATGFLGWEFGLSLTQSILIIVFGSLLGASLAGFCATLGPATGLRQISIGRYSMGWYPNKIIAALNTIQQIGWSSVGCITGGLALTAVSDGRVSIVVGIIVIAVCSLVSFLLHTNPFLTYANIWAARQFPGSSSNSGVREVCLVDLLHYLPCHFRRDGTIRRQHHWIIAERS